MQTLHHSYRGLSLVMQLNWDLLLYVGTILAALTAGGWLLSML
ncbi:hypothetical protein [Pseudodonghicola flavimaris]|uniref:Uncharacterized protein n=1 Tax=Pseudodonghicola flavimaris TaxID=3050036 RepID=A0ABT7F6Y2_9RHOB|nr:hypothetical protein [Pseudodonghicola flavimaris]MDK3020381.1 hypothetical protein [Pseudodonghicola flavimaris]